MMGQGFGDAIGRSLAVTAVIALTTSFALGWLAGSMLSKLWDVLRPLIHAATA